MKFGIKELKEVKTNLKADKPVKIHLALELDKKSKGIVETLNYRFSLLKKSEIKYYDSLTKPQITIVSGIVKDAKDYLTVKDLLGTLFQTFRIGAIDLQPTKYYFSKDGKWLLLGLKTNEFLTNLAGVIKDFLRSYVNMEFEHELHISIAKFDEDCSKKFNLSKLPVPKKVHIETAMFGLSGENGGMLEVAKKYKM